MASGKIIAGGIAGLVLGTGLWYMSSTYHGTLRPHEVADMAYIEAQRPNNANGLSEVLYDRSDPLTDKAAKCVTGLGLLALVFGCLGGRKK
ncbi:MAG: hypothetical protein ABIB71_05690 [Candidatus Woesearchaeota archaeon]